MINFILISLFIIEINCYSIQTLFNQSLMNQSKIFDIRFIKKGEIFLISKNNLTNKPLIE